MNTALSQQTHSFYPEVLQSRDALTVEALLQNNREAARAHAGLVQLTAGKYSVEIEEPLREPPFWLFDIS